MCIYIYIYQPYCILYVYIPYIDLCIYVLVYVDLVLSSNEGSFLWVSL